MERLDAGLPLLASFDYVGPSSVDVPRRLFVQSHHMFRGPSGERFRSRGFLNRLYAERRTCYTLHTQNGGEVSAPIQTMIVSHSLRIIRTPHEVSPDSTKTWTMTYLIPIVDGLHAEA